MVDYEGLRERFLAGVSCIPDGQIILDLIERRIPKEVVIAEVYVQRDVVGYNVCCPTCGCEAVEGDRVCWNPECAQALESKMDYWSKMRQMNAELEQGISDSTLSDLL